MGAISNVAPENWGATMRLNNKIRLVVCLGALAAGGFLVHPALACGEAAWADSDEPEPGGSKLAAMAVMNPSLAGANSERDAINAAPIGNSWIAVDESIIGAASFYDDPQQTASGEHYDPEAFTAAAQLKIRDKFGGIRFGRLYQPAYAVAEYESKKIILKFNDVGPLRAGRKFDLSRAAMAYFQDLEKGLLMDLKVTPLPLGQTYIAGPVTDAQLLALSIGDIGLGFSTARAPIAQEPSLLDSRAIMPPSAESISDQAEVGES
jgi:hypothetical protein